MRLNVAKRYGAAEYITVARTGLACEQIKLVSVACGVDICMALDIEGEHTRSCARC